jgi:uncharacterized lipoprotein YmbA
MKTAHLFSSMLVVALSACTSAPVHYRTLLAPAAPSGDVTTQAAPYVLNVLPVGVPPQLDTSNLVVRESGDSVQVLDNEQWAAPFGDEVRSALSAQLGAQLGTHDIAGLSVAPGVPVVPVKVQIRRFDAWPGHAVHLEAGWSLGLPGSNRRNGYAVIDKTVPGDYTTLINAEQQAIHDLALKIAGDIDASANTTRNPQDRP